jgi:hypothetical protein
VFFVKQRGRKSPEAQAAISIVPTVIDGGFGVARIEPPSGMPEAQAELWREIVKGEPTDFFNTATLRGILQNLCRHQAVTNEMSELIDEFKPEWLNDAKGLRRYEALLKIREKESRAAAQMATKLRLTNQSRYTNRAAASATQDQNERRPWHRKADEEA